MLSVRMIALLGTLSLTPLALAQSQEGGVDIGGAQTADPGVTLRALESMNDAAASKLADATSHEKSLRQYIQAKGLDQDCNGNSPSGDHPMQMSFEQALQVAIDHEQVAPSGAESQPVTEGQIRAYTTLAKSTWDKLQTAMANVEHLSDCVHGQGSFDDYTSWSHAQAATRHAQMQARNAEASKEAVAKKKDQDAQLAEWNKTFNERKRKQHQAWLKQSWTKYKFDQKNALKAYKYRTEYGPGSYYNTYAGSMYGGDEGGYGSPWGY